MTPDAAQHANTLSRLFNADCITVCCVNPVWRKPRRRHQFHHMQQINRLKDTSTFRHAHIHSVPRIPCWWLSICCNKHAHTHKHSSSREAYEVCETRDAWVLFPAKTLDQTSSIQCEILTNIPGNVVSIMDNGRRNKKTNWVICVLEEAESIKLRRMVEQLIKTLMMQWDLEKSHKRQQTLLEAKKKLRNSHRTTKQLADNDYWYWTRGRPLSLLRHRISLHLWIALFSQSHLHLRQSN